MIVKKNLYYIVKDGTRIVYKGKDKTKVEKFEANLATKEDAKERAIHDSYEYHLTRLLGEKQ